MVVMIAVADWRKISVAGDERKVDVVAFRPILEVSLVKYHYLSFASISPVFACSCQIKPKFCLRMRLASS